MRRILIVDDQPQMVKTFLDILHLRGWEADGAYSGEEALDALRRTRYNAVVMDVRMPGMNGVETFTHMKRLQPGIRVILMTAYSAKELIDEAEKEGAIAVLPKPVNVTELIARLETRPPRSGPVLVVDDDPSFLRTLATILRREGYETLEATGVDEAVAHLQNKEPKVVLLDLRLNDGVPREALLAIREVNPAVSVILYSGHPALLEDTLQSVPDPWIHGALHKPFGPDTLLALLERVAP